jgi:hypothetical protein
MDKSSIIKNIFQTAKEVIYPTDISTKSYLIFYPTEGYHLSKKQYNLFMNAISKLGLLKNTMNLDIEFIDDSENVNEDEIRSLTNLDYAKYEDITLLFENCIIDEELRWSICIYQDYWGIIYGSKPLLDELLQKYDFKYDLKQFEEEIILDIGNEEVKGEFEELIRLSYIGK